MNELTDGRRLLLFAALALFVFGGGGGPVIGTAAGPREVAIVYETKDVTPAFSRLLNTMRSGPAADYLKSKNHHLDEIDYDAKSVEGVKADVLEKYGAELTYKRNLIIADKASGKLIAHSELTDDLTAAAVIEYLKKNGG